MTKYILIITKFKFIRERKEFNSFEELSECYNKEWKSRIEAKNSSYKMHVEVEKGVD